MLLVADEWWLVGYVSEIRSTWARCRVRRRQRGAPPCQAPSVSAVVNSCMMAATTSSASWRGRRLVSRPTLTTDTQPCRLQHVLTFVISLLSKLHFDVQRFFRILNVFTFKFNIGRKISKFETSRSNFFFSGMFSRISINNTCVLTYYRTWPKLTKPALIYVLCVISIEAES